MHIEFLVEEPSMEVCLEAFLPKLLGANSFNIVNLHSKSEFKTQLPKLLKGYANRIKYTEPNLRVVLLLDQDDDVCTELKQDLEVIAHENGLLTKTKAEATGVGTPFYAISRIVCKELEAWFFGDPVALKNAYTRLHDNHFRSKDLKQPDKIAGKTAKALLNTFNRAGIYPEYANPKLQLGHRWKYLAAQLVGEHLDPNHNASPSFQAFVAGVRSLIA